VAALLAAMMVSAGPAQAQANEADFENSTSCIQADGIICGFGDDGDDFGDVLGFDGVDGLAFFDGDDDAHFGDGDIDEGHRLACFSSCNFDTFDPGGVSFA